MFSELQDLGDSYKYSHYKLYPKNMIASHSYFEARSDKNYNKVVFFGLQYMIERYLKQATDSDSLIASALRAEKHGIPFDLAGWDYINKLGYLPVKITAKPEGSICDIREPLMTVESTDPAVAWLPSFLETLLVKLWYPCTVATKAYYMRETLKSFLPGNSDNAGWLDFAYHNFGDRGSSSVESAALAGMAHLIFFKGTDNFNALECATQFYPGSDPIGFSIPATEHSVMTSWGVNNEDGAIMHLLESYAHTHKLIACVLDSYDLFDAVKRVTDKNNSIRKYLETSKATLVLRPDSGDPVTVLKHMFQIMLENEVGFTLNNYGLKLFDNYRIIWGDGITPETIKSILANVIEWGFSPDNMAFGSGGDLCQNCNRDTLGFAYKLSAVRLLNKVPMGNYIPSDKDLYTWAGVCKDPITDSGKKSKAGLQKINDGVIYYENGETTDQYSFADVRENAGIK